ncbi:MAG: hypothetical protein AAGA22_02410, partial [Pseudomonadota bacterium]
MREHFHDDNIRVGSIHAKYTMLRNEEWHVVAMTSANLNLASRIEMYHAADCPEFYRQFQNVLDLAWASQKPGEGFEDGHKNTKPNAALKQQAMEERGKREGFATAGCIPLR